LPVGKKPSDLWLGEENLVNDIYLALYDYFKDHESYCFEYLGHDFNDAFQMKFGAMKLTRVGKWLAYFGMLGHEVEHKDKKLWHTLKPTDEGWKVLESGRALKFEWTHLNKPSYIGVGKPYASYAETETWLNQQYTIYKVSLSRQMKWHGEFVRDFNYHLEHPKDEMLVDMQRFLAEHLATIKVRGRSLKNTLLVESKSGQVSLFGQTKLCGVERDVV
jgi:hypothetical protein